MKLLNAIISSFILMAMVVAPVPAHASSATSPPGDQNILLFLAGVPELSVLLQLVVVTDSGDLISGKRQHTVFAPTNQAFEDLAVSLGLSTAAELLTIDPDTLRYVLEYHFMGGRRSLQTLVNAPEYHMLNGEVLTNSQALGSIIGTDFNASNGVIHVVDQVFLPPAIQS